MAVTYRLCEQAVPYKTRLTGRLILLGNEGFGAKRAGPLAIFTDGVTFESFRGGSEASEPGISRFPDVQLHI